MKQDETFIIRALLGTKKSIYRDIEIKPSQSLQQLAAAIVQAFDFDFDHAFGFYTGRTSATLMRTDPRYELFADIGEADPGVIGVEKTSVAQAFPAGHRIRLSLSTSYWPLAWPPPEPAAPPREPNSSPAKSIIAP